MVTFAMNPLVNSGWPCPILPGDFFSRIYHQNQIFLQKHNVTEKAKPEQNSGQKEHTDWPKPQRAELWNKRDWQKKEDNPRIWKKSRSEKIFEHTLTDTSSCFDLTFWPSSQILWGRPWDKSWNVRSKPWREPGPHVHCMSEAADTRQCQKRKIPRGSGSLNHTFRKQTFIFFHFSQTHRNNRCT